MKQRIALITGTLAEPALGRVAQHLTATGRFELHVIRLNIQVAALMTTPWVGRKLQLPADVAFDRVILPGYCRGELEPLRQQLGVPVERGPKDLHDLPQHLGQARQPVDLSRYDIEIIAEINHAAHQPTTDIVEQAQQLVRDGADVIDLGCDPQVERPAWGGLSEVVRELRSLGIRVSIDSYHVEEIAAGAAAGAELVLSVNSSNREAAPDWGVEVVAVPDEPSTMAGLDETVEYLASRRVKFRIDPILEPIGAGFAASLGRYMEVRRRYGDYAMMMGVGNLTELTEVDSAGVNMMLAGLCQELQIGSVLTTQVINWSRSSVRELDRARHMVRYAVENRLPPKHLGGQLVMLRDPRLHTRPADELQQLARSLTDRNVRLFAQEGQIHAMNKSVYAKAADPYEVFKALQIEDASHAFYLGYEMAKAVTALTLGKNYVQDEPLRWGMLQQAEVSHYHEVKQGRTGNDSGPSAGQQPEEGA